MRERSRFRALLGSALVAALALGTVGATGVDAAIPLVEMTIKMSPTTAAAGATVRYTGTVTPVRGTPTNVMFGMQAMNGNFTGGDCAPAAHCNGGFEPSWSYASLTSKVTVTFTTTARIGRTVTFFLLGGTAGCTGTCPPSVTGHGPTLSTSMSWSSDGQVVAGATLHLTVRASTNAGPIDGNLHVNLPTGVDAPTNLPSGAMYAGPPSHYIDKDEPLANSAQYEFDVMVNAASGSALSFGIWYYPNDSSNGYKQTIVSIKVGPDATPPTATTPSASLVAGHGLDTGRIPTKIGWSGADGGSGVESYQLAQQVDGGAWAAVDGEVLGTWTYRNLSSEHDYRFRVRAVDHAGNIGAWAYGTTFELASVSEASSTLHYGGSWATSSSALYRGGKARIASTAGRTVSRTFTGRGVAWLALKGATKGKAQVYVDGSLVATIDLYASTTQAQQLVWAKTWSTSASRTVKIKVLGTNGRPTVNLDGLILIR